MTEPLRALPTVARSLVVRFTVPGNPIPWRRVRRGRGGEAYVPADVVAAEQAIGFAARAAGAHTPERGPMELEVAFYRSDRRRADGSNLQKLVEDGMNGVVYHDDSQITDWRGRKRFDKDNPRTEVEVWKLEEES